jgi:hypothetical protein
LLEDIKRKPTSHGENQNKPTRDARLDFSSTNHDKMTRHWLGAIKKKADSLPAIYQRALAIAGFICAKQTDNDMDSEEENDRADIESETDDAEDAEDDVGSEMSSVH